MWPKAQLVSRSSGLSTAMIWLSVWSGDRAGCDAARGGSGPFDGLAHEPGAAAILLKLEVPDQAAAVAKARDAGLGSSASHPRSGTGPEGWR
jgi:hypothetical protein